MGFLELGFSGLHNKKKREKPTFTLFLSTKSERLEHSWLTIRP